LVPNSHPREEWHLHTRRVGRTVLIFDRLDSTNSFAAALAHDVANDGTVILADEQTAGRGQYGRRWQCPPGSGILMSVLLFPAAHLRRPALLTAWAAVSACDAIRETTGLAGTIKWPNDVLVRGKKVCGVLIEQGMGTVAGIGINVNQTAESLANAGLPFAGSLAQFSEKMINKQSLTRILIETLDRELDRLCRGDCAGLEMNWKARIALLGKRVKVTSLEQMHQGCLLDIRWEGLDLLQVDGQITRLALETVRQVEEL